MDFSWLAVRILYNGQKFISISKMSLHSWQLSFALPYRKNQYLPILTHKDSEISVITYWDNRNSPLENCAETIIVSLSEVGEDTDVTY